VSLEPIEARRGILKNPRRYPMPASTRTSPTAGFGVIGQFPGVAAAQGFLRAYRGGFQAWWHADLRHGATQVHGYDVMVAVKGKYGPVFVGRT
jgi:hypothetical protein